MTHKVDALGRRRRPAQDASTFKAALAGRRSKSHNVNTSEAVHAAFAALSPVERGDLIELALNLRE